MLGLEVEKSNDVHRTQMILQCRGKPPKPLIHLGGLCQPSEFGKTNPSACTYYGVIELGQTTVDRWALQAPQEGAYPLAMAAIQAARQLLASPPTGADPLQISSPKNNSGQPEDGTNVVEKPAGEWAWPSNGRSVHALVGPGQTGPALTLSKRIEGPSNLILAARIPSPPASQHHQAQTHDAVDHHKGQLCQPIFLQYPRRNPQRQQ